MEKSDAAELPWILKFEQGPCFGDCAVFTFFLLDHGKALLDTRHQLLEPGWYIADLDTLEINNILRAIEPDSWWMEDKKGGPVIQDLPVVSIIYKHKRGLRGYAVQENLRDEVTDVIEKLNSLVMSTPWKHTSLRPLDPVLPDPTDVIIHLREGADIDSLLSRYTHFGIQLVRKVAPRLSYYVVRKDPARGSANDFLQYLRLDKDVIDAQYDRELQPRD